MQRYSAEQVVKMVGSLAMVYNIHPSDLVVIRESALVLHGIKERCYDISLALNPMLFNTLAKYFPEVPESIKLPGSVTIYKAQPNGKEVFMGGCSIQSMEDLFSYYMAVSPEEGATDESVEETILAIENEMERLSNVSSKDALRYCDQLADEAMCLIVQSELSGVLNKLKQNHTTVIKDATKRRWSVTFKPAQKMIELFEVDEVDMHGNVDIHQITIDKVNRHI